MSEPNIKLSFRYSTMEFKEPQYWVEPRLDLRGRPLDFALRCDAGVDLVGFETEMDAYKAALSCNMKMLPRLIAGQMVSA